MALSTGGAANEHHKDRWLAHPPQLDRDIGAIVASGTPVFAVAEDLQVLGIRHDPHVEGVRVLARADLPELFEQYEQVWQ